MQSQLWPPGPSTSGQDPGPHPAPLPTVVVDHFERPHSRATFEPQSVQDGQVVQGGVQYRRPDEPQQRNGVYVLSQLNTHDVSNICVVDNSSDKAVYVQKCSSQIPQSRTVVHNPEPPRRYGTTRTVVVNSNFYGAAAPTRRVVVNSRISAAGAAGAVRVEALSPPGAPLTAAAHHRAYSHASLGPLTQQRLRSTAPPPPANGVLQAAHRRLSHSLEDVHQLEFGGLPSAAAGPAAPSPPVRRPTTVVVTRTIRPTTLSYATTQRNALPVTVKLPSQSTLRVPRLSSTVRDERRIPVERPVSAVLQSSSARVRPIDPKYKDKSNRAFVAFRKEQQQKYAAAVDKRKRDYSQPPPAFHALAAHARPPCGSFSSGAESKTSVSPKSERDSTASGASSVMVPSSEAAPHENGHRADDENSQDSEVKVTLNGDEPKPLPDYAMPNHVHISPGAPLTYVPRPMAHSAASGFDLNRYEFTGQTIDGQPVVKARRPGRPRKTDPPVIRPPKESKRRKLASAENGEGVVAEKKRKQKLSKRDILEEIRVADSYMETGFDEEDLCFIRKQFEEQQMSNNIPWKQQIPWMNHDVIPNPKLLPQPARFDSKTGKAEPYFCDLELADVVPNSSGCARAEPYRKVEDSHKQMKRRSQKMIEEILRDRALVYDQDDSARGFSKRMERARRDSQSAADANPYAKQAHGQKLRPKITKVSLSAIHGWGLFVMEQVAPGELIMEYVGEEIRMEVADVREKRYLEQGKLVYMFSYDSDWVIDATMMGNAARFINHSCRPNCVAETKLVDGVHRIYIYSKTWIDKGQELTYDYKFPVDAAAPSTPCYCGDSRCRKTL